MGGVGHPEVLIDLIKYFQNTTTSTSGHTNRKFQPVIFDFTSDVECRREVRRRWGWFAAGEWANAGTKLVRVRDGQF